MPELPEVETMRRGVAPITGSTICGLTRPPCRLKPILISPRIDAFRRRVVGHRIKSVDRIGKRVGLRLDNDSTIIFEPRMTGLVLLADPPGLEHLRFVLQLSGRSESELLFWDRRGLGSVRLVEASEWDAQFGPHKLGPDALDIDAEAMRKQLGTSRREIKVALLDQRAIAGIGNLYASEMLNVARIHPARPCDRLTKPQWQRLCAAMQMVLHDAIKYEGSTLSDGTYRNALNSPGSYQNQHRVYARAGQKCRTCNRGVVQRFVQAQRATFFCPVCQSKRRVSSG